MNFTKEMMKTMLCPGDHGAPALMKTGKGCKKKWFSFLKGLRIAKMKIYIFSSQPWTEYFFSKLLINDASHDTEIGCIRLVWAGAKKYIYFHFCIAPALSEAAHSLLSKNMLPSFL